MHSSKSKILNVNVAQQQAVNHTARHLLIVAGPGTGKTHTLTHRIAHLVQDLPASRKILAVTFTNKAADEMRQRLSSLLSSDKAVHVGTFHSIALGFLREFVDHTALPKNFRIGSPDEIERLAKNLWPSIAASDRKNMLDDIAVYKGQLPIVPNETAREYDLFLRAQGIIGFDDIMTEIVALIEKKPAIARTIRNRYCHICVDEYQDCNEMQHAFLKAIVKDAVGLTAIGDPNQAIYGFRGSDVKFFERFTEDFPGASVHVLNENYRSTENLLQASTQIINAGSREAVPVPVVHIHSRGRLTVHVAPSERAEAEYVVHEIEKLVGGTSLFSRDSGRVDSSTERNRSFGDIAVLYRLNAQRHTLEEALERSGIPFQAGRERALLIPQEMKTGLLRMYSPSQSIPALLELFQGSKAFQTLEKEDAAWKSQWPRYMAIAQQSSTLEAFFDRIALQTPEDLIEFNVEKVTLLTLHASKGLEFPVVFIVGCEDNIVPLNIANMTSNPAEERRLFYVGMTRAKEELYLTYSRRRQMFGQTLNQHASRFLADIAEELKAYDERVERIRKQKRGSDETQLDLF